MDKDTKGAGRLLLILCVWISFFALASSCSPRIIEKVVTVTKDSIITEIHERVVHDTVGFEVPVYVEVNTTTDTTSRLENPFAVSEVKIEGGVLHHSLRTKPQTISVPVTVTVTDTTTTHIHSSETDHTQTIEVEVEKPLSKWKTFQIRAFWWLCGAVLACLLWIFRKTILKLVKL